MKVGERTDEPADLRTLARQTCLALYDGDRMAAVEAATRLAEAIPQSGRSGSNAAIVRFFDQARAQLTLLERLFPDPVLGEALTRLADRSPEDGLAASGHADGGRGAHRRRT